MSKKLFTDERTDNPKLVRNLTKIEFFIFSRYDLYLDAFDLDKKFLTIQKFNFYDWDDNYILKGIKMTIKTSFI